MNSTLSASWYDVLDVDPNASADQIRTSWRSAVAELDPTDRRFRVYNQAAEAADAAADEATPEPAAAPAATPAPEPAISRARARLTRRSRAAEAPAGGETAATTSPSPAGEPAVRRAVAVVPGWLLVLVAVVLAGTLTVVGVLLSKPSDTSVEADTQAAQAAAERAIVPLLSYDAHHLDQSRAAALPYLSPAYRSEYDKFFQGVVQANAKGLGTVVQAQYLSSGIVRTGDNQVDVLVFVNQKTLNKQHPKTPVVYRDQATLSMVKIGGSWLIDGLTTNMGGK